MQIATCNETRPLLRHFLAGAVKPHCLWQDCLRLCWPLVSALVTCQRLSFVHRAESTKSTETLLSALKRNCFTKSLPALDTDKKEQFDQEPHLNKSSKLRRL